MRADRDTYGRILHRMKRKLNRNMTVLELACSTGILSVQLAGEYLDFLRANGFTVISSKVYGSALALTYAEAKVKGGRT